jgi:hypothetical protein
MTASLNGDLVLKPQAALPLPGSPRRSPTEAGGEGRGGGEHFFHLHSYG